VADSQTIADDVKEKRRKGVRRRAGELEFQKKTCHQDDSFEADCLSREGGRKSHWLGFGKKPFRNK